MGSTPSTELQSDHLGSASVATTAGGAVASSQEYDAWGKVRSGGITQTNINYTGQRLDGSGLLYYHARMYDPVLGRFVSADSISPNRANPQTRNRYSYVLNNPLKYRDPTGHCAEGFDQTLAGCEQYLNIHGWNLNLADWIYDELKLVADSLYDLKRASGWSITDYRNTMTGNGKYELQLERKSASEIHGPATPAEVGWPNLFSNTITMRVFDALFDTVTLQNDRATQLVNLVHEQAHVWDAASGGAMSKGMMKSTGSYYEWWGLGIYVAVGGSSSTYLDTHLEDWAETVTAAVYPTHERFFDPYTSKSRMGASRRSYIQPLLPHGDLFTGGW